MQPNHQFINLRKKLGPSQQEFADKTGISRSTIADIERGRIKVSKRVKEKIVEKYPDESGLISDLSTGKNVEINQGDKSGLTQGSHKKDRTNTAWGGENKAVLDTYKLVEKIYSKTMSTEDLRELLLRESAKHDDKTLYYYLKSTEDLKTERPDLGEANTVISDFVASTHLLIKVVNAYFSSVLNADIKYTDYESFKANRVANFEQLFKYVDVTKPLLNAINNFIQKFKDFDNQKVLQK